MFNEITASKLYTYFTLKLGMEPYKRGWLKGDCPSCGKTFKFGVHIEDNRTNCFSCGYNRKPMTVIYETENLLKFSDVYNLLKSLDSIKTFKLKDKEKEKAVEFFLPEGFKLVGLEKNYVGNLVVKNLKKRNFNIRSLQRKGIGYCTTGPYKGRIIFPYYQDGKLVYFNARKFLEVGPKFKNPTEEEAGVGKSMLIYNIDALSIYDKVYLFESVTNCITLGDRATGTGGKSLSKWQTRQYINSPCKSIVIGLDPDAMKEAYKTALELSRYKKVKVLIFPEGKDANDLGKKATKKLEKNTPYKTYKEFYKLYLNAKTLNTHS